MGLHTLIQIRPESGIPDSFFVLIVKKTTNKTLYFIESKCTKVLITSSHFHENGTNILKQKLTYVMILGNDM